MILCICPNPSIDCYAWLPQLAPGSVNRITALQEFAGGKGTHVAFALKELGENISLMGNWAGNTGEWIKAKTQNNQIKTLGVELKGSNRKCYTFRADTKPTNNTELLEPGPLMTQQDWKLFLTIFENELPKYRLVCMSGSWPKGAPQDAYLQLLRICNQYSVKAILDCSGIQLKNALTTTFYGLHINEHEAKEAFGADDTKAIFSHLKNIVSLVALTKGKDGLHLAMANTTLHANVHIEKVVSTVGSGDCLTAGVAYGVANDLNINDIAKFGVACGAANCLNEDLGMLKHSDVQRLYQRVEVNADY